MENKIACCFTGSRPQNLPYGFNEQHPDCVRLKQLLLREIQILITAEHVSHFISGMALGVDQWAAEAVLSLKETDPEITLESALPCEAQAARWKTAQQERYRDILKRCDKVTVLQQSYTSDCMQKRNRYMVDHSHFVLAVWSGQSGGTANTLQYARRQRKLIVCIHPEVLQPSLLY